MGYYTTDVLPLKPLAQQYTVCDHFFHGVFGGSLAYITFHPLVALVAMLAGGGPGVLATVLSGIVVDMWIIAVDQIEVVEVAAGGAQDHDTGRHTAHQRNGFIASSTSWPARRPVNTSRSVKMPTSRPSTTTGRLPIRRWNIVRAACTRVVSG